MTTGNSNKLDYAAIIRQILGSIEDEDILEYIIGVVEDDSFEFGNDAEDAVGVLAPLLVRQRV